MDDELSPEERFRADDAEEMVPRALLAGRNPDDIAADLRRLGWTDEQARKVIFRVENDIRRFRESPEARRQLVREARTEFFSGLALLFVAVGFAILTILASMIGLMPGVLLIGAFVGGLFLMGRGWGRWQFYRRLALALDRPSRP